MDRRMDVQPLGLGAHEFIAEIVEDAETTQHRVTIPSPVLRELDTSVDEQAIVGETMAILLARQSAAALPEDIDLTDVRRTDPTFLEKLRARLG